jgi:HD superfamily phosphohydrolase
MYWQAYLHKTSLVAELMLTRILKRAKELTVKGVTYLAANYTYFLQHKVTMDTFDDVTLDLFAQLDDFDIISA